MVLTAVAFFSLPAQAAVLKARVDDSQFLETGYAQIRLSIRFEDAQQRKLRWQVKCVRNRAEAMMPGYEFRKTGLSWQAPKQADGSDLSDHEQTVQTAQAEMMLFDVLGERDLQVHLVVVNAKGEERTYRTFVHVGEGPIARFEQPQAEPTTWVDLYKICNGHAYSGAPNRWKDYGGLKGSMGIPGGLDIMSIAGKGKYNVAPAWNAAAAAGWTARPHRWWLTGSDMINRARHMDIRNGNSFGYGGNDVHQKEFGVCLKAGYVPRSDVNVNTRDSMFAAPDQKKVRWSMVRK